MKHPSMTGYADARAKQRAATTARDATLDADAIARYDAIRARHKARADAIRLNQPSTPHTGPRPDTKCHDRI